MTDQKLLLLMVDVCERGATPMGSRLLETGTAINETINVHLAVPPQTRYRVSRRSLLASPCALTTYC